MIGSSTHKLKRIAIIFLVAFWSQPVLASSVEIVRWSAKCDSVTLKVKVDQDNVSIQDLQLKDFKVTTTNQPGQEIKLKLSPMELGEYEITYRQPGSERASRHQIVVQVVSESKGLNITTSETIRMPNFNYCPLPLSKRLLILALTLIVLGIPGLLLFKRWSDELKSQNEELLSKQ